MRKRKHQESLYRTRWLMAHNHLHEIIHGNIKTKEDRLQQWSKYLAELRIAKNIADRSA